MEWIETILQLCHHDYAIREAAMALGGLSQRFETNQVMTSANDVANHLDLLSLSHYQKSLRTTRKTLEESVRDKDVVKQTLVSCILFVIIEFLRGNEQALLVHLRSGCRLLQQYPRLAIGEARHVRLFVQIDYLVTMWLDLPNAASSLSPNFHLLEPDGHFPSTVS